MVHCPPLLHSTRKTTLLEVHCTVLYTTILYCNLLHYTLLYCTLLYCTVVYSILLSCTIKNRAMIQPWHSNCTANLRQLQYRVVLCIALFITVCRTLLGLQPRAVYIGEWPVPSKPTWVECKVQGTQAGSATRQSAAGRAAKLSANSAVVSGAAMSCLGGCHVIWIEVKYWHVMWSEV